jgi:uncharacterized protein YjiS (DUF1127 family)
MIMNQIFDSKTVGSGGFPASRGGIATVSGALARLADTVLLWHKRARDRRLMSELDDRLLGDIGISRGDAIHEMDKPFWRA